ncbi:PREDICTED: uncharacterized protein LOC102857712 [Elephantulus edwardii]|uniref:uncharacterized protein LOC102857712 n=1 Tax=Elephantulus edwardii TaxID=28737 RepID=UPI0003F058F0|nr:PREDICTED: uncharacterized protein LOC102857712 [Elephantulus edwardii]
MAAEWEAGESGNSKSFKLLGNLDVQNIPCARDSVLYGSLGSVVAGLGHFLLTSKIRRSCDVGVGGFILVTLGYWFHCRYNCAKLRIQERITREGIKNKILYESTHLDPERKFNLLAVTTEGTKDAPTRSHHYLTSFYATPPPTHPLSQATLAGWAEASRPEPVSKAEQGASSGLGKRRRGDSRRREPWSRHMQRQTDSERPNPGYPGLLPRRPLVTRIRARCWFQEGACALVPATEPLRPSAPACSPTRAPGAGTSPQSVWGGAGTGRGKEAASLGGGTQKAGIREASSAGLG